MTRLYVQSDAPLDLEPLRATFRALEEDGLAAARRAKNEIALPAGRLERAVLDTAYTHDLRKSA